MMDPRQGMMAQPTGQAPGLQANWGQAPPAMMTPSFDLNTWGRLMSMGGAFMGGLAGDDSLASEFLPKLGNVGGQLMSGNTLGEALQAPQQSYPGMANLGSALFDMRGGSRIPLLFQQSTWGGAGNGQ